jgi:hypothetical protein
LCWVDVKGIEMTSEKEVKPTQHFNDAGNHRLEHKGRTTSLAGYRQITYLDGWVGATAYWGEAEGIYTADEFCKLIGVR